MSMSDRLRKMMNKNSLRESVGGRAEGYQARSPVDVSGSDMTAGRYGLRQASMLALDRIIPDPNQPRKEFGEEGLKQLSKSIRDRGLMQPIRVRWSEEQGLWIIVSGERRYRAHQLIKATEIAAVCVEGVMSESDV